MKTGTVTIIGRPNVGKSTLLSALAGQKLSIVTPKPQTTRHRVEGAISGPGFQMILADTPGSGASGGSRLAHAMNREGDAALSAADAAILVVAAPRWTRGDDAALDRLRRTGLPIVLAVNKIDCVKPRMALLPFLERAAGARDGVERAFGHRVELCRSIDPLGVMNRCKYFPILLASMRP